MEAAMQVPELPGAWFASSRFNLDCFEVPVIIGVRRTLPQQMHWSVFPTTSSGIRPMQDTKALCCEHGMRSVSLLWPVLMCCLDESWEFKC
eukprot:394373-Amphidinium_carterae.1